MTVITAQATGNKDGARTRNEGGSHETKRLSESMYTVAFDEGPEQMPADVFNLAIARFDQAMAAGASGDILRAAQVGKARAQINLNQKSAAMSTASSVPDGFTFELHYSNAEAVTRNKLWEFNIDHQNVTVAEPYRDVPYADSTRPARSGAQRWARPGLPASAVEGVEVAHLNKGRTIALGVGIVAMALGWARFASDSSSGEPPIDPPLEKEGFRPRESGGIRIVWRFPW